MARFIVVSLVVGALASCANNPGTGPATAKLDPAPQPTFAVGDKFVWETKNGQVTDEIMSISNGNIVWQRSDGSAWITATNFALPATRWSDPTNDGAGNGEQKASEIKGAMFPLKVGNKMSMRVKGKSDKHPEGWDQRRNCEAKSQENITVPAGSYDAFRVVCESGRRKQTFFYSPKLGQIVYDQEHHTDKGRGPRSLVSYDRVKRPGNHQP